MPKAAERMVTGHPVMTCPHCRAANIDGAVACARCQEPLGSPALGPGRVLADRYRIVKPLGAGGMGQVFEAHDRKLDLRVAIKVLHGSIRDADSLGRLRSEVKLARKVRHRHVGMIYDYGEDGDLPFISMELVEGQDLRHLVHEQGPLDWEPAYEVALQMAEGLVAIHEAGIIHRDLKPANIMIDLSGQVRVMDFGIAKGGASAENQTQAGHVVGTPEYMSPEQVRAQDVDFRSDLYAFGVVIFEIFTGAVPFHASTPVGTMLLHLEERPPLEPPPPRLPSALVPLLRRALAKDVGDRFSSCAEMLEALRFARQTLPADLTDAVAVPEEKVPSGERPTEFLRPRAPASPAPALPEEARLLVPMLCQALRNAQSEVRLSAMRCLMRHGPTAVAAIPNLQALLIDPDAQVHDLAEQALIAIAPLVSSGPAAAPPTPGPTATPGPSLVTPALAGPLVSDHVPSPPSLDAFRDASTDPNLQPAERPGTLSPVARASALRPVSPRPPVHAREPAPREPKPKTPPRHPTARIAAGATILAVLAIVWRLGAIPVTPTATPSTTSTSTSTTTTTTVPSEHPPRSTLSPRVSDAIARPTTTTTVPTTTTTTTLLPELTPPPTTTTTTTTSTTTTTTLPAVLESPACLKCPVPEYPIIAIQRRVQGTVQLRLLVDETGRVTQVEVVKPVDLLTDAAVKAARARIYRPARRGGVAEKVWVAVPIDFRLPN